MKKKLLLLLCATLIVSATGCKKEDVSSTISNIKESVDDEIDNVVNKDSKEEYELACYVSGVKDYIYTIDEDGNKTGGYNLSDYEAAFGAVGANLDEGISTYGVQDGILYFSFYHYAGENYAHDVYALDTSTKETAKIYTISDDWYDDAIDYYQGKLYIDIRNYEAQEQKELCFTKTEGSLSFSEESSDINSILEKTKGKTVSPILSGKSLKRSYDEAGFIIAGENVDTDNGLWNYYKETTDGETAIDSLQNTKFIVGEYSKDFVYAEDYDDQDTLVVGYSLNGGKDISIAKNTPNTYRLTVDGNKVYYYSTEEKKYGVDKHTVYCYDLDSDSAKELYSCESIPGTGNNMFGIDAFKVIGGNIYTIQLFDKSAKWARYNSDKGVLEDIDLPIKDFSVFEYGIVNYQSGEWQCPYCGIPVEKNYTENFVLDSKWSEHAAEINKALEPMPLEGSLIEDDSQCSDHKEYPEQYCETDDTRVGDVAIINNKYLTVNMSDYWYGGGAHGMPGQWQRVFDLTTGEELSNSNLYPGTVEELKTLIAQKTKELYEKESGRFFAETAEDAYNQAYDYIDKDSELTWYEDHAVYSFPPYEMGPYASGYIDIVLPYSELLGTNTLERKN